MTDRAIDLALDAARKRADRQGADAQLDKLISAFDALHENTGLLSDEFCTL